MREVQYGIVQTGPNIHITQFNTGNIPKSCCARTQIYGTFIRCANVKNAMRTQDESNPYRIRKSVERVGDITRAEQSNHHQESPFQN